MQINKIYNEDCLTGLKKLDDESIDKMKGGNFGQQNLF